ncbi:hypothetical protein BC831DRAFT_461106 [Entophlyctis helioformis]|nr:hypothetical protein BC831DRAFT_461106 [Entophlyctis helioformis]
MDGRAPAASAMRSGSALLSPAASCRSENTARMHALVPHGWRVACFGASSARSCTHTHTHLLLLRLCPDRVCYSVASRHRRHQHRPPPAQEAGSTRCSLPPFPAVSMAIVQPPLAPSAARQPKAACSAKSYLRPTAASAARLAAQPAHAATRQQPARATAKEPAATKQRLAASARMPAPSAKPTSLAATTRKTPSAHSSTPLRSRIPVLSPASPASTASTASTALLVPKDICDKITAHSRALNALLSSARNGTLSQSSASDGLSIAESLVGILTAACKPPAVCPSPTSSVSSTASDVLVDASKHSCDIDLSMIDGSPGLLGDFGSDSATVAPQSPSVSPDAFGSRSNRKPVKVAEPLTPPNSCHSAFTFFASPASPGSVDGNTTIGVPEGNPLYFPDTSIVKPTKPADATSCEGNTDGDGDIEDVSTALSDLRLRVLAETRKVQQLLHRHDHASLTPTRSTKASTPQHTKSDTNSLSSTFSRLLLVSLLIFFLFPPTDASASSSVVYART